MNICLKIMYCSLLYTVEGEDYFAGPYIVEFLPGVILPNTSCINITTRDDENVEGDQEFTVSILEVNLDNNVALLEPFIQTATLTDNDGNVYTSLQTCLFRQVSHSQCRHHSWVFTSCVHVS